MTDHFDDERQLYVRADDEIDPHRYAKFDRWRMENKQAIERILTNLESLKGAGKTYCSTARLMAFLRDHFRAKVQTDLHFAVNDHIAPYLTRHLIYIKRDLHLFRLRRLTATKTQTLTCPACGHRFEAA